MTSRLNNGERATKDELIEALAEVAFDRAKGLYAFDRAEGLYGPRYHQVEEDDREDYRVEIMVYLTVIVDCVESWLKHYGDGDGAGLSPSETRELVAAWREEMG